MRKLPQPSPKELAELKEAQARRVYEAGPAKASRMPLAILGGLGLTGGLAGAVEALGINLSTLDLEGLVASVPKGMLVIVACAGYAIVQAVREASGTRTRIEMAVLRIEAKIDAAVSGEDL